MVFVLDHGLAGTRALRYRGMIDVARRRAAVALALLPALTGLASAQERDQPSPDKSAYSFWNPVPDAKLRDFSTDRPGKSHSSTTVDAGRFQIEADFFTYTYDPPRAGQTGTRAYSIGAPILKAGVTNSLDIQVSSALFNSMQEIGGSMAGAPVGAQAQGFGDTAVGAKLNLFGNDSGSQSLALLPFVKLPTAARGIGNGYVEYTLHAPYTVALTKDWSVTLEPNVGILRNQANNGYRQNYGFIVNVSRPVLVEGLTAAVEVAVDASSERGAMTKISFDPSLQYLVTKNLQLDAGVYLGLNRAAPRYNPYVGISYRF